MKIAVDFDVGFPLISSHKTVWEKRIVPVRAGVIKARIESTTATFVNRARAKGVNTSATSGKRVSTFIAVTRRDFLKHFRPIFCIK